MKYLLNVSKYVAALAGGMILLNSCDKVKTPDPMGDAGQTLVKIIGGGNPANISKKPIDFVPTAVTITAADVRRDLPNNAELNRTMHVTVIDDTAAVTAADPNYIHMDPTWYTVSAATPKSGGDPVTHEGGTYDVTFAPGEFAKPIDITIANPTLLDPSSLYAIGFTITTADADGKISQSRSVVVEIGAKNNWDGIYINSGTFLDVSNAAFTYYGDQQYSLITVGASTCDVFNDDLGTYGYIFSNAGSGTYYGAYGLVISFNPATNAISDLHNYYGDPTKAATPGGNPAAGSGPPNYAASNGRRAVIDPSGTNAAQGNKDIIIKHWMFHPSVVPSGPRSFFDETWAYQGPR